MCLLPFYHTVSSNKLPHIQNLYQPRSIELFKKDITFFCKNFSPVSIDDLYDISSSKKKPKSPVFHLTFDDGLSEVYHTIAPLLLEAKIPTTIFLNSAFIDNKALFYRYKVSLIITELKKTDNRPLLDNVARTLHTSNSQVHILIQTLLNLNYHHTAIINDIAAILNIDFDAFLKEQQPYLTKIQITELENSGFKFGAHSQDHPMFKAIPIAEQKRQVTSCFTDLATISDMSNRYFAFPFSDVGVSEAFFNWLHREQKCRLSFGTAGIKDDTTPFNLQRIAMEGSNQSAEAIIKTELLAYNLKTLIGKNNIVRAKG